MRNEHEWDADRQKETDSETKTRMDEGKTLSTDFVCGVHPGFPFTILTCFEEASGRKYFSYESYDYIQLPL